MYTLHVYTHIYIYVPIKLVGDYRHSYKPRGAGSHSTPRTKVVPKDLVLPSALPSLDSGSEALSLHYSKEPRLVQAIQGPLVRKRMDGVSVELTTALLAMSSDSKITMQQCIIRRHTPQALNLNLPSRTPHPTPSTERLAANTVNRSIPNPKAKATKPRDVQQPSCQTLRPSAFPYAQRPHVAIHVKDVQNMRASSDMVVPVAPKQIQLHIRAFGTSGKFGSTYDGYYWDPSEVGCSSCEFMGLCNHEAKAVQHCPMAPCSRVA